ncbi:MAG: ATP-binding protein [Deltaproteobacteria bacterium]|nr:ATP-binding protein [Deltaproteobacteria bacterium]
MERSLKNLLLRDHFPQDKMAFVVGPRQVGKTTLSKMLLKERKSADLYRNWDDLGWRRSFARDPYGFIDAYRPKISTGKPLAALDEIHKFPRWKRYLKGLWDTRHNAIDILVTGSGRLDVYQRGGDSLLGRYHQYRLHPLSIRELLDPDGPSKEYEVQQTVNRLTTATGKPPIRVGNAFESLLTWGGFPEPFLKKDKKQLRLWHRERRELIVRQDLRDLTRIQLLSHVEELMELLVDRCGNVLSHNSLREDLQVALDSVRLWVDYLRRLYFLFLVRPYAGTIARALRREPKVYLWDWSEIENPGVRFENMVASHLLKWCHFTQDWGHQPLDLHFVRDKEKREVDFLITQNKRPWLLIEAKLSSLEPGPAIHHFGRQLGVEHKFLVVAESDKPGLTKDVHVIDAPTFFYSLPV